MAGEPEQAAQKDIDRLLTAAGWSVQDYSPNASELAVNSERRDYLTVEIDNCLNRVTHKALFSDQLEYTQ